MFGWFRNKPAVCPVADDVRVWLEESWAWLGQFLGDACLQKAEIVLPRPQFFPDPFRHTEDDARVLCNRLCEYMGLPSAQITLHFYETENQRPQPKQTTTPPFPLWVSRTNLADVRLLIGLLVRELGYARLCGSDRATNNDAHLTALADLATVYLGLGVVAANTVLYEESWHAGYTSSWMMQVHGALTMAEFGYALALFAHDRDDDGTTWEHELRADVRAAFQQAQRYLAQPEEGEWPPAPPSRS